MVGYSFETANLWWIWLLNQVLASIFDQVMADGSFHSKAILAASCWFHSLHVCCCCPRQPGCCANVLLLHRARYQCPHMPCHGQFLAIVRLGQWSQELCHGVRPYCTFVAPSLTQLPCTPPGGLALVFPSSAHRGGPVAWAALLGLDGSWTLRGC